MPIPNFSEIIWDIAVSTPWPTEAAPVMSSSFQNLLTCSYTSSNGPKPIFSMK